MVGLLVSTLYNVVDIYFVGRLGTSQTAAGQRLTYPAYLEKANGTKQTKQHQQH